ncbi:SusC/RagA family TonB-linked outer membrane protein [Rhodocytophaga rosea]|uniref:SusC/RagA family TonB-linked outer membrane protein n=1 Tax=Rhodocytophaga rosea TaxID=2704465 RepID=A0A6C0GEN9_9BACT|nr:SusC/RagA family TonB-linked outer membrane protein [Rhodocytophaga rosea]QHT66461.1 SusC/RagA family TonB-linked outer membrane protein [Rhodocytophaga rosea]
MKNTLHLFLAAILLVCATSRLRAQEKSISGTVTSVEDGSPLPGVNVLLKGTTNGTTTDIDGKYTINAVGEGTLVFSYIGFTTQEIPVSNRSTIDVKLAGDDIQLTEVVVTAAGIERDKKALGYSVSTLDANKIAQKSEPDPIRALTGKVAGVNIQGSGGAAGGATNINIRGNSSLGNNNQPLFVVDGVPFDNSSFGSTDGTVGGAAVTNRAFDIDPNNILSMNVLKGAAAAALYGSRAANGAIIIITKSGRKKSRKGLEITYNTAYSTESVSGLPDYQTKYGQGTNFDYRGGVFGSWGQPYSNVPNSLIPTRETVPHPLAVTRYPSSIFPQYYQEDGITPIQVPYRSYSETNAKDFFRRGSVYENAISISTGNEKASFTGGLSRTSNQGVVPENEIVRTAINIGGNAQLDNKFYVGGSLNYVNTAQTSPQLSTASSSGGAVVNSIMDILMFVPTSYDLSSYPYTNPLNGNNIYDRVGTDNPYWSVYNSPTTSKVDRYYGNLVLGLDLLPWLNIQNTIGFNAYTDRRMVINGKGGDYFPNGNITTDNIYRQELDNTLLLTATKSLTDNIGLKVILGSNVNQRITERQVTFGDGIIFRGINSLNNTSITIPRVLPNNRNNFKQRYYAFFTDISLDYKNYAFLNLVARNDVSSTLPANNRSYLYGGVNASLIFTEAFDLPKNILSFGKVRAGYTRVGNEATPYQTQTVYTANPVLGAGSSGTGTISSPFIGQSTLTQADLLANANLKPEFITELEVGAELQFFQNRLGLDITYYNKISTSQIFTVNAVPSSGFSQKVINLGKSSNEGIEIGFNATPIKTSNGFTWDISSAFTLNRNIVRDIGSLTELPYGGFSDLGSVHIAGRPYGQIRGSTYAKDEEGNVLVNPNTGKPILSGRIEAIGNPNPDFILGITNTFRFKNFTLSALFDWKEGGDMYSFTAYELLSRGVTRDTEEREQILVGKGVLGDVNTLQPLLDGDGNKIPNNIGIAVADYYFTGGFGPGGADEVNILDATVFRLREVSLGYEIPEGVLKKTPFGSASVSVSGRNLWYFAPNFPKYLNFDPETSSLGSGNSQGFDFINIPTTRRFGVNLRVSF